MALLSIAILFSSLSLLLADAQADSAKGLKPRNERLFYVFTSKTTSTAITNTYCYVSTNTALTTICGRRKRRATIDDFSSDSINPKFLEGKTSVYDEPAEEELDSSLIENTESEEERKERALLYWLTTYSVTTSFSYTQTFTLASLACTPSGYQVTECKSL